MIRFIKLIQDSDFAAGLLLLFVASFSYAGVADNIWEDYGYIDWVFPLMSCFLLFSISAVYLVKSSIKIVKGTTISDLKIDKSEIPSIINVVVYTLLLFCYLVLLFVFGFWAASILLLWSGITYFRPEINRSSIVKSLIISIITCVVAYIVFTHIFYVPFPQSRIF